MLNMIKYKGCKRCGGDLFLEKESEGLTVSCLQCGAIYVKHIIREEPAPEPRRRKVLAHR